MIPRLLLQGMPDSLPHGMAMCIKLLNTLSSPLARFTARTDRHGGGGAIGETKMDAPVLIGVPSRGNVNATANARPWLSWKRKGVRFHALVLRRGRADAHPGPNGVQFEIAVIGRVLDLKGHRSKLAAFFQFHEAWNEIRAS